MDEKHLVESEIKNKKILDDAEKMYQEMMNPKYTDPQVIEEAITEAIFDCDNSL